MSVDRVIELMIAARQLVGSRPLLLFAAAFAILAILPKPGLVRERRARWLQPGVWLAMGAIAGYATLVIWYAIQLQYADAAEPTIAAVAWLFKAGQPIYHAPESAERYAHIYGPLAFIIPAWSLSLLGTGIITSKIHGTLAGLLNLAVMFALARTVVSRRSAVIVAGLFAGICLMFQGVSFWNRPDSLLILMSGVALLAVIKWRHALSTGVGLGLATGILIDLKITGALYALPAFAVLIGESRTGTAVLAALVSALVAALPFVVYANVSSANYLHWLSVSAGNGLQFLTFKRNLESALFLMIPLAPALMSSRTNRRERLLLGALAAGIAMTVVAASKPGAGPYHLLPFVPAVLYAAAAVYREREADANRNRYCRLGAIAFTVSIVVIATLQSGYFVLMASRTRGQSLVQDLDGFVQAHPGRRIEMGYSSENEPFSFVRPFLVFRQRAYLLDAPAIQELQMSGIDLPSATIHAVDSCAVDFWLIPKGGTPFSLRNRYPSTGHVPLFPEAFRIAFDRSYQRSTSTTYFDVWVCRAAAR